MVPDLLAVHSGQGSDVLPALKEARKMLKNTSRNSRNFLILHSNGVWKTKSSDIKRFSIDLSENFINTVMISIDEKYGNKTNFFQSFLDGAESEIKLLKTVLNWRLHFEVLIIFIVCRSTEELRRRIQKSMCPNHPKPTEKISSIENSTKILTTQAQPEQKTTM